MPSELLYVQQILTQTVNVWLPVTLLVGLLTALIFKPDAISSRTLFSAACWLLGLSLIVSPMLIILIGPYLNFTTSARGGFNTPSGLSPLLIACMNSIGPMMQGASILCGLFSLIPRSARHSMPTED
jgi:hypothetical protein